MCNWLQVVAEAVAVQLQFGGSARFTADGPEERTNIKNGGIYIWGCRPVNPSGANVFKGFVRMRPVR